MQIALFLVLLRPGRCGSLPSCLLHLIKHLPNFRRILRVRSLAQVSFKLLSGLVVIMILIALVLLVLLGVGVAMVLK